MMGLVNVPSHVSLATVVTASGSLPEAGSGWIFGDGPFTTQGLEPAR